MGTTEIAGGRQRVSLGQLAPQKDDQRWLWRVECIPGESLSSVLHRQASLCGISFRDLLYDLGFWHQSHRFDPDRDSPNSLIDPLAIRLGVPAKSLHERTLWSLLGVMGLDTHHVEDAPVGSRKEVLHWVLPSKFVAHWEGARGIPFCPLCIFEQNAYWTPLTSRLGFSVVCEAHGCLLHERCPACDLPTSPAQNPLEIVMLGATPTLRCKGCAQPKQPRVARTGVCPVVRMAPLTLLNLHSTLMSGLSTGRVLLAQVGPMPLPRFLAGLRRVHTVMFHLRYQGEDFGSHSLMPDLAKISLPDRGSRASALEVLSLEGRLDAMVRIARFCEAPIDHWDALANSRFDLGRTIRSWMHPWDGIDDSGAVFPNPVWTQKSICPARSLDLRSIRKFFELVDSLSIPEDLAMDLCGATTRREYLHWRRVPRLKVPFSWRRRAANFVRFWDSAVQILGSDSAAEEWLVTPSLDVSYEGLPPIELLAFDDQGQDARRLMTILRNGSFGTKATG